MRWIFLALMSVVLGGCIPTLAEIHAEKPERTGLIHAEYKALAACAKEQAQIHEWWWEGRGSGKSPVTTIDGTARPLIRLYATTGAAVMFEMTFQPAERGMTHVDFRSFMKSQRTQDEAWPIIDRCARQLSAPSAHDTKED